MKRIAYLVSSAREITLADGRPHPTGYFAEEALKPYERFVAAGHDVVVITPDGNPPNADPYGLSWFFHYPAEDKDFLASVVRTFANDVDDIRFTLHQNTELGLASARRIHALLQSKGHSSEEAHRIVSSAARRAWREDRKLSDVLLETDEAGTLTREELDRETNAQRRDSEQLAAARLEALHAIPGFRQPVALSTLSDADVAGFDAVFAPGGHGPMVDLVDNPDVARLLVSLQDRRAPIVALCHGPALLLSAPERWDGQWLFDGYRMTCFTDEEEDQTEPGRLGLSWYVDTALKNAGAVFDDGPAAWASHVVVDRNLVTGQNPGSTEAIADAVIRMLARAPQAVAA
jgi:putative intracellular protease/amidase